MGKKSIQNREIYRIFDRAYEEYKKLFQPGVDAR